MRPLSTLVLLGSACAAHCYSHAALVPPRRALIARRAPPVAMDVQLVADTISATSEGLNEQLALAKPHFFEGGTLFSDMWITLLVASLGLAGAYVTQGTEVMTPRPPPRGQPMLRDRRAQRRGDSAEDDFSHASSFDDLDW